MTLAYCIPTYNSFARCVQAINAVMQSSVLPDKLIIIDDSGTGASLSTIIPTLQAHDTYGAFQVWVHEQRCGVARSWNHFLAAADTDLVLIANDDAMPHRDTIKRMLESVDEHPDDIFFCGDGSAGNAFSFFLIKRAPFIEKIGWFDENFFPAYFEDDDMSRRITLAGFAHVFVNGATYDHVGSSTLHTYNRYEQQLHHEQFRANERYFIAKWGGKPREAIYHTPFNRQE